MSLVAAIDAEIASLEAELLGDERYVKLLKLREIRKLYGSANAETERPLKVAEGLVRQNFSHGVRKTVVVETKRQTPSGRSERQRALEAAERLLTGEVNPVRTSDILSVLASEGIHIGGQQPTSNLSAMLYHSSRFKSYGRAGWTLASDTAQAETESTAGSPIDEEPAADTSRVNGWSH